MQSPPGPDLAKFKKRTIQARLFPRNALAPSLLSTIRRMRDPEPGDRIDQYQLTAIIARGGMASIFQAVDIESGATVALKVPYFHYESDPIFYQRFQREEEIGQRLDHPGIVRVLTPREKSRLYLAMEYVPGQPLRARMPPRQPLPAREALDLARQVAEALAHMHARGVVHRDLKPENLLVTPDGKVKISDFGIAMAKGARRLTWSGLSHSTGTPDYSAPEQIHGGRGDARSDVFALGVLLYEMLTGRLPWEAPSMLEVLRAKRSQEPTPPRKHFAGLDPALEAVVLRAIAREPADRQASAAELLADLRDPAAMQVRPPAGRRSELSRRAVPLLVAAAVVAALTWVVRAGSRTPARHSPATSRSAPP